MLSLILTFSFSALAAPWWAPWLPGQQRLTELLVPVFDEVGRPTGHETLRIGDKVTLLTFHGEIFRAIRRAQDLKHDAEELSEGGYQDQRGMAAALERRADELRRNAFALARRRSEIVGVTISLERIKHWLEPRTNSRVAKAAVIERGACPELLLPH